MKDLYFSFVIPVYNRPNEIKELLDSFISLEFDSVYEIIIVEDGSDILSKSIVEDYTDQLHISYYIKPNSGPGDSRNYGMKRAKGNYFIILDSDCLLPNHYLKEVQQSLKKEYTDCYGGPDAAHEAFTNLQKAINFAMTSFMTTGGIRGGSNKVENFQPRSFNMGISKKAFGATEGFGAIHPGEDPDLSIRLVNLGFKTKLIKEAYVYHKRRISWSKFYKQVHKFGLVRPILNKWHPQTNKLVYWLPSLFMVGLALGLVLFFFGSNWILYAYGIYFFLAFVVALVSTKNILVALQAIVAIFVQFFGYGYGFLKATILLNLFAKAPERQFPNLFFKHVD